MDVFVIWTRVLNVPLMHLSEEAKKGTIEDAFISVSFINKHFRNFFKNWRMHQFDSSDFNSQLSFLLPIVLLPTK